ncbi:hypothetical protein C2845_PM10G17030 [Panicum miliaceum]|uniref:Uncharacterized protein n=1 Tax=Panicum miliaceum TaxID=4540 RepID=A0A3L6PDI3_PANMI|nr:hypothetical protein C2845_PM10G17030 [Panicum miliaceum]
MKTASVESSGTEVSEVWWRLDTCRHQGGRVATREDGRFRWLGSKPPRRQVSRFGSENRGCIQCGQIGGVEDTGRHREACVEAKQSHEDGVSVRWLYQKLDKNILPCVGVYRSY